MNNLNAFRFKAWLDRFGSQEKFLLVDALSFDGDRQKLIEDWLRLCNDPLVYKAFYEKKLNGNPYSINAATRDIDWASEYSRSGDGMVVYVVDEQFELKGNIILNKIDEKTVSIGYCVVSDFSGAMTNALNYIFEKIKGLGIECVIADCWTKNVKSISLLKRLGFVEDNETQSNEQERIHFRKVL